MIWGFLIPDWLKRGLAYAGVALAALGAAVLAGMRIAAERAKVRDLKGYQKTRKRIDDAKGSSGNRDDDIDWLRDHGSE